jgi:hypothetical protein
MLERLPVPLQTPSSAGGYWVDAPNAFQRPNIERVLRHAVAWALALKLAGP